MIIQRRMNTKNIKFGLTIILLAISLMYACKKTDLLEGDLEPGVALTFDDASIDKWVELLPMFQRYGVKATFFICTACSDNSLDTSKLLQLFKAGNEIGSHTLHHITVTNYLKLHTLDDYYNFEIVPTLDYFKSLNIPVSSFAYPGGDNSDASDNYLSKYFSKLRAMGLLRLAVHDSYIFHKKRKVVYGAYIDHASPYTLEEYKNAIRKAKDHNAVLLLVGHSPGTDPANPWSFSPALLDSICNYTVQLKMKFYRMQDL